MTRIDLAPGVGPDQALLGHQRTRAEIQAMADEIKALNRELEATNRGVIAIHKELEERSIELSLTKDTAESANLVYEALLKAASDLGQGVILTRGADNIHYANEAFAQIAGRELSEIVGADIRMMRVLYAATADPFELAAAGGDVGRAGRHYEASIGRPDGLNAKVEVGSTDFVIRGEMYRLALVRDVTKLKHDAIELEDARQRLAMSEKLAALGSLVAGVAHEVRTPLTIIATNLEVLGRYATKATQTGDYARLAERVPFTMGEVTSAIERVQSLVKGLGRFTRALPLTVECLLDPIVREAVDLYDAVNRSHTRVVSDLRSGSLILADTSKIQQIVINLLENAVQASRASDKPVSIRTYLSGDGTGVVLEVEDRGTGMTSETKAHMFEPLFTTKVNGTGVGLSIVQRILEEHKATIRCQSERGVGTTFTIQFPARSRDPAGAGVS